MADQYTPTPEEQALLDRMKWQDSKVVPDCWEPRATGYPDVIRRKKGEFVARTTRTAPTQSFPTLVTALVWLQLEGHLS